MRRRGRERERIKKLLLQEGEILNVEVVRRVINKSISGVLFVTQMRRRENEI